MSDEMNLEQIMIVLENIEEKNLSSDPSIKEWMYNICHPDFKLVTSLTELFLDNILDLNLSRNILKVLRKFTIHEKNQLIPQLQSNKMFPIAISNYIIKNKASDVSGDAFVLLGEIYQSSNFKEVSSKEFITCILDSFEYISEEEVFNSIVLILTQINYESSDDENSFMEVFVQREDKRFLVEGLMRILNNTEDKLTMYRILKFFRDAIAFTQDCLLYSSDLEAFVSLSIKKLETTTTEELRRHLLSVLEQLTKFDDYYKSKYKLDELVETLESYENSSDVVEENRYLATQILENIKQHC